MGKDELELCWSKTGWDFTPILVLSAMD